MFVGDMVGGREVVEGGALGAGSRKSLGKAGFCSQEWSAPRWDACITWEDEGSVTPEINRL